MTYDANEAKDYFVLFLYRAPGGKGKPKWIADEFFSRVSKAKLAFNAWRDAGFEAAGDYEVDKFQQIIKVRATDKTINSVIRAKARELNAKNKTAVKDSAPKDSDLIRFTLFDIASASAIATSSDLAYLTDLASKEFARDWGLPELEKGKYYLQWGKIIMRDGEYTRVIDDASGTYRIVTNKI